MIEKAYFFKMRKIFGRFLPRPVKILLIKLLGLEQLRQVFKYVTPDIRVQGDFSSFSTVRETVLVVSHEGSRTGAPILSYNLVKSLQEKYNVVALFLGPGPIMDSCHESGAVVVGPLMVPWSAMLSELAINKITKKTSIKFALVNSIESRHVLPALANQNIATVTLIHEFAANTRPLSAFQDSVFWSDEIVFSTKITCESMIQQYPELGIHDYPIIPQGSCVLPTNNLNEDARRKASLSKVKAMRPEHFPNNGIVIVGIGTVQFRKGVDLFIECAAKILQKAPNLPFRFIWVGKGFDPENDVLYSVYLADQIRRAGLDEHIQFFDEMTDLDSVYSTADILVLSSRLDPLPNVAISALINGLPLVCFDKTTGIAAILDEYGLSDHCVVEYLNTSDLASKVLALAQSKDLRDRVSEQSAILATELFQMDKYINQIEQLALKAIDRSIKLKLDKDTIESSGLLRVDYYRSTSMQAIKKDDLVKIYLRSWSRNLYRRKLFPGFHPGIYLEQHGLQAKANDALVDYLQVGKPTGPWAVDLITLEDNVLPQAISSLSRTALHVHVYYPDIFPEMLKRLKKNQIRPDLLISVTSESARLIVARLLETYEAKVDIRVFPNRGRNIGPLLTGFKESIQKNYDLIGHLHTKKTADLESQAIGKIWYRFLLENLLGGKGAMMDKIISRMIEDKNVTMVFPDDPNIIDWGKNFKFAASLGLTNPSRALNFPVGTMFWARPIALKPLFDLNFSWEDYPEEPLPYDGTLLHAIERSLGIFAIRSVGSILMTNVTGVTR